MQSFRPSLSSISQNIVRGGFEAAALIEHLLNDEEATYQDVVLQPVNIINRLSTDFYSTTDAHIQTALKYIHQNIAADITVSDIVKQVPLSRRLLEFVSSKSLSNPSTNTSSTLGWNVLPNCCWPVMLRLQMWRNKSE